MDDSYPDREASPDWLRTFQSPLKDFQTLPSSSTSTSSHDTTPKEKSRLAKSHLNNKDLDFAHSTKRDSRIGTGHVVDLDSDEDDSEEEQKVFSTRGKSSKKDVPLLKGNERNVKVQSQSKRKPKEETELVDQDDQIKAGPVLGVLPKVEGVVQEEDAAEGQERRTKRILSALPLVFGDKVHRSKVLLECDGEASDLSGDVGAVGRLSMLANQEDHFLLDLKGIIYKGTVVPSNTFFVVNIGPSEAKVEAIMNDFVQLQASSSIFEAETMVEGTLEDFGFDLDDDGERALAPSGMANVPQDGNESEDGRKQSQQKARLEKTLKVAKASVKRASKAGTSKNVGKSGGSRKLKATGKSMKKSTITRKSKGHKRTGK